MPLDLQAAATEYLGWLQLEANRSPNTVRAYESELRRLMVFLATNGHSMSLEQLRHDDLRAYQRHLAGRLKSPASRARALVAIRSWLRWLAKEGLIDRDLSNGITLPKLEQRLPKPIDPDELTCLLAALPSQTLPEKGATVPWSSSSSAPAAASPKPSRSIAPTFHARATGWWSPVRAPSSAASI